MDARLEFSKHLYLRQFHQLKFFKFQFKRLSQIHDTFGSMDYFMFSPVWGQMIMMVVEEKQNTTIKKLFE